MTYTTIFEKLLCLFELVSNSWLDIAFVGFGTFLIILLGLKKISKTTCFGLSTLACSGIFGYIIYQYFEPLSKMMDSLIDNVFTSIYFPSAYVYLFILITTDVITIGNLLNPRSEKIYKTIHGITFIIINFVLTIILEMIAKNNIDIFSKKLLFSNTNLIILLEFSVMIFLLWLVSLFIIYVVNIITERIIVSSENKVLKQESSKTIVPNLVVSKEELETETSDKQEKELPSFEVPTPVMFTPDTTKNHFIPTFTINNNEIVENSYVTNNYQSSFNPYYMNQEVQQNVSSYAYTAKPNEINNTFDLSAFIPQKQDIRPIQNLKNESNEIFAQILNNELPIIHEGVTPIVSVNKELEEQKNTYTLNDYRIFNKMLKDIREHNQSNSVSIDKNLEYRLITKYSTETYQMFKKMLKIYSN